MINRLKNIGIALLLLASNTALALPTAKVTLKVVDDQGVPVEGAEVRAGFESPGGYWQAGRIVFDSGYTDSDGIHVASSSTSGRVGYRIEKEGYYETGGSFTDFSGVSGVYGIRRWQPWNPILEVELRKIRNPIPLYAKGVEKLKIPELNRPIGYDLIAGDWVIPFGQGTTADFVFTFEKHYQSMADFSYRMLVSFVSPSDGLLPVRASVRNGSQLLLPHHAPTDGYRSEYKWGKSVTPTKHGISDRRDVGEPQTDDLNFFFRVRSQYNSQGELESALYGKIYSPIAVGGYYNEKAHLSFTYYLNPTSNDTNLEWDRSANLFNTGLKDTQ